MLDKYEEQLLELHKLLETLGDNIVSAASQAQSGVESLSAQNFENAKDILKNADSQANEIDQNILKTFALFEPEAMELRELIAYLKITSELVRLSDNIKSFSKRMNGHINSDLDFSTLQEFSTHLAKSAFSSIEFSVNSLLTKDKEETTNLYRKVCVEESKTDDLYSILEKNIMADLCKNIETSTESIGIMSTMRKLERMADRSVNITKLMLFARKGGEMKHFG